MSVIGLGAVSVTPITGNTAFRERLERTENAFREDFSMLQGIRHKGGFKFFNRVEERKPEYVKCIVGIIKNMVNLDTIQS